MRNAMRHAWIAAATPALLLTLAGCKVGPDYAAPDTPTETAAYLIHDPIFDTATEPAAQWWLSFNDPTLNQLVDDAIAHNHDLQAAILRVREVRELLIQTERDRIPTVTANGGYERQRLSRTQAGSGDRDRNYYFAGFDATWELDIFGRVARSIEAAEADIEVADARRKGVLLAVVAEVASTYMDLRGAQQSLAIAHSNAENQQRTYQLALDFLNGGRGTELDTARALAQLEATLATIPALQRTVELAAYRLAVLTGQPPAALLSLTDRTGSQLPIAPDLVPIGNPVALLRNRPDVRQAERSLAAATARIGIQTAELYPRVVIVGSLGVNATRLHDLNRRDSFFGIGPHISWPAFDLGRVQSRVRAAGFAADAQAAEFQQVVLESLEEVQANITAFARERERLLHLLQASNSSKEASDLARVRYEQGGIGDFLSVLDAERRTLEAEQAVADSRTSAMVSLVAVYKALGCIDDPEANGSTPDE